MVRSEIVACLALKLPHLPAQQVESCGHLIIEAMIEALCRGDRVEFRGWGSMELRKRNARIAHDPSSGRKVLTPERFKPHFKAGGQMRQRVNAARADFPLKRGKKRKENELESV